MLKNNLSWIFVNVSVKGNENFAVKFKNLITKICFLDSDFILIFLKALTFFDPRLSHKSYKSSLIKNFIYFVLNPQEEDFVSDFCVSFEYRYKEIETEEQ